MKQFDYYSISGKPGYLVVLQSDELALTGTVVVAPLLVLAKGIKAVDRLNPVFRITDADFILATHLIFSIQANVLQDKVGSVAHARNEIIAALDLLYSGV